MKVKEVSLYNFRSFIDGFYSFLDGINIIYGNNGVGKTTILESIGSLSESRSFRTRNEQELIYHGQNMAIVSAKVFANNLTHNIRIDFTNAGKKIKMDSNVIYKISDFIGSFIAVIFTPDDVNLFGDAPKERRKFIDAEMAKMSPIDLFDNLKYHKLLATKSRHLRGNELSREYIDVLNTQLANLSLSIIKQRKKFLESIEPYLNEIFSFITGKKVTMKFRYYSFIKEDDQINQVQEKLNNILEKEIIKKSILIGIHQDDYTLFADDIEVSSYFSQGEKRIVVLALKLALAKLIEEVIGEKPIVILDDVLSELDKDKKNNLMQMLFDFGQVFISTTTLEELEKTNLNKCQLMEIRRS